MHVNVFFKYVLKKITNFFFLFLQIFFFCLITLFYCYIRFVKEKPFYMLPPIIDNELYFFILLIYICFWFLFLFLLSINIFSFSFKGHGVIINFFLLIFNKLLYILDFVFFRPFRTIHNLLVKYCNSFTKIIFFSINFLFITSKQRSTNVIFVIISIYFSKVLIILCLFVDIFLCNQVYFVYFALPLLILNILTYFFFFSAYAFIDRNIEMCLSNIEMVHFFEESNLFVSLSLYSYNTDKNKEDFFLDTLNNYLMPRKVVLLKYKALLERHNFFCNIFFLFCLLLLLTWLLYLYG